MSFSPIIWDEAYLKMRSLKKKMKPEIRKKLELLMEQMNKWASEPPPETEEDLEKLGAQSRYFQSELQKILKEMEGMHSES